MKGCKKTHDLFIPALYNELNDAEARTFHTHLAECSACAGEFAQMQQTLGIMDQRVQPDPGDAFWDGFWGDVSIKLQQEKQAVPAKHSWWHTLAKVVRPRIIIQLGSAAALILVGLFLGKIIYEKDVTSQPEIRVTTLSPALQERTTQYLEQTNLLLLGIANFDAENEDPYVLDLNAKKHRSQDLVQQAAVLKGDLERARAKRLLNLISDLELILMQLANLDTDDDVPAIEFVQSVLDRNSILLKINVEKLRSIKETHSLSSPKKQKKDHRSKI